MLGDILCNQFLDSHFLMTFFYCDQFFKKSLK